MSENLTNREEVKRYLEDIGITNVIAERIENIYQYVQRISPCKILDVFVSDYMTEDGSRMYELVGMFSDEMIIVTRLASGSNEIMFNTLKRKIHNIIFESKDYDFLSANSNSRLSVSITYEQPERIGEYRATGKNCDYLMDIIRKYKIPFLKGQ